MAHFARVENNVVTDLIVVDNDDCGGGDFPGSEPIGQAFIARLAAGDPRLEGTWLQTSYNTRDGLYYPGGVVEYTHDEDGNITGTNGTTEGAFRGNFGQIGFIFNPAAGAYGEFFPPEGNE
jgi:hypothetical protein